MCYGLPQQESTVLEWCAWMCHTSQLVNASSFDKGSNPQWAVVTFCSVSVFYSYVLQHPYLCDNKVVKIYFMALYEVILHLTKVSLFTAYFFLTAGQCSSFCNINMWVLLFAGLNTKAISKIKNMYVLNHN